MSSYVFLVLKYDNSGQSHFFFFFNVLQPVKLSKSNKIRPYFKTILFFIVRILPKLMIAFMDSQLLLFILVNIII